MLHQEESILRCGCQGFQKRLVVHGSQMSPPMVAPLPKDPPSVAPSPGGHVERVLEPLLGERTRRAMGFKQVSAVTMSLQRADSVSLQLSP